MKYSLFIFLLLLINSSQAQEELTKSHPISKHCQTVYNKLKAAIGDNRASLPRIIVLNRKKRVAAYRSMDNVIIIEKAAYELCKNIGEKADDALAFLIGHELTHFYQQTDWEGRQGRPTHFLLKHEILKEYALEEEEADSYSAFIAYLADYNTLEIIPSLLEQIYEGYNLKEELSGYPSLEDREEVVTKIQRKVRKFIQMYESANYYIAIGWNAQAQYCYRYLLKFIRIKELYHNIGVIYLATAIERPNTEQPPFLYPIDIDLTNVFKRPYSVDGNQEKLLLNAEKNLKKALDLDSRYCSAYLNLACVYNLKGDVTNALTTLNTASNLSPSNLQRAKMAIIKGIVYATRNQTQTAGKYFDNANKHYQNLPIWYISNANKQILASEKRIIQDYSINIEDAMDDVSFRSERKRTSSAISLGTSTFLTLEVDFSTEARSYFSRFFLQNKQEGKDSYTLLQRTRNKELLTTKGIKAGDKLSVVQKAYKGEYFQVVHYHKGFFLVYPSKGLVFQINQSNRVREWAVFAEY